MNGHEPRLIDTGRGFNLQYRGHSLYSSVDPQQPIRRRAAEASIGERTLVFVPSVGLGYGLAELLDGLPKSAHVLCVEVDQALMAAALRLAPEPLPSHPQLTVVRSDSPGRVVGVVRDMGQGRFRRVTVVRLSRGYSLHRQRYDEIERALREEIETYWKNKIILAHLGPLWIRNIIENLPEISRCPAGLGASVGRPVVVAGAGPSLELALPLLRRLRSTCVILAVDTAAAALREQGIEPDLLVALEAQLANLQDFVCCPQVEAPLICDITCAPAVARRFAGRVRFYTSRFYPLALLDRMRGAGLLPQEIPPLGSVGVAALRIALEITDSPVLITGLDFSYTRGRTHSRSTPFHVLALQSATRLEPVVQPGYRALLSRPILMLTGKGGGEVMTDLVLQGYSASAARMAVESGRVFDLDDEGLRTGIPRAREADRLKELWEFAADRPATDRLPPSASPPGGARVRLDPFVHEEIRLLRQAMRVIERRLKSLGRVAHPHAPFTRMEETTLREVDYLYFSFPDPESLPVCRGDFLARMRASAANHLRLWERLAERLGR